MTTNNTADLRSFFGGYFHEDWEMDSSEPDEVIAQFLRSKPSPDEIDRIVAQIRRYLGERDDAAIERGLFEELGCYYLPTADDMSAREWLKHVADLLSKG
jgi:hypothetical protein